MSLGDALCSPDAQRRATACREAARDPSAIVWVDALGDLLADRDGSVRDAASDALAAIGRDHDLTATLKRILRGRNAHGRWAAARTLARLAPPQPALIPAAVEALDAAQGSVRWQAARLLVALGRLHAEVPQLLLGLAHGDRSPRAKRMALFCLRELAPDDARTCETLLEASQAADPGLRRAAFTALAGLLEPPPDAFEQLDRAARGDQDPGCRTLAARALRELTRRVTPPARP